MKQNKTNEMFDAAFRIISDNLDTELISSLLGIKPDHSHRKGEFNNRRSKSVKSSLDLSIKMEFGASTQLYLKQELWKNI